MVNSIFVRGGVKTNCGRPCSPEGASWLLRVEQNTLGPDGEGTISDQIVESCRENHRYSVVDVDQPINDVMPEIVPISYPVDVELGQNDSCCVDTNVDCIPCLRSVNNVDAVCSIVYEQENRCSRTVEPLMCTGIDVPVEYICTPIKTLDIISDCDVTDVEACPHLDYCNDSVQPCYIYYESELCDVRPSSRMVSRDIPEPYAVLRGNMGPYIVNMM